MYSVSLSQFSGPIELLLHLVEKAEMDIRDIRISEITSQYLAYMDQLGELEPDAASEFAAVAATLLLIKSRSLLPRPVAPDPEEEEDPETALLRQIREYKVFKEASADLAALKEAADRVFLRLPEEFPLPPPQVELSGATLDGLYHAFVTAMLRLDNRTNPEPSRSVARDEFTIGERMTWLKTALSRGETLRFSEIMADAQTKMEVVVTFMALLELISSGRAHVSQQAVFGEIVITGRDAKEQR